MTVGVADLLDMAISPEIGPVNFFHLRNLLHTFVEHFGISEIEAQQAEVIAPGGYASSTESEEESSEEESDSDEESEEEQAEPEVQIVEEEVQKTIVDEDGNEKTVTVTIQKEVIVEPEKKKDGESKKKSKEKDRDKDKDKSEKKDKKHKSDKSKSKSEKDVDEKEGKKHSSKAKGREKSSYGSSSKDIYGKPSEKKKLTADTIGEIPEVINLTRRLDAVENGLKGLRNIVDSMVNQVDFGDEVGDILKAQLNQVQEQMNKVELIQKEEPKEKKKKKGKKGIEQVPNTGIVTEGQPGAVPGGQVPGGVAGTASVTAPGAPTDNVIPMVIPPPAQRGTSDTEKGQRTASRKEGRKGGVQLKGAAGNKSNDQGAEKPPLKKRTTLKDLQIRKKAREEGVSVEEIEAREAAKEATKESKDEKDNSNQDNEDNKEKQDKKDPDADETSSMESMDSAEEQAAMDEMIMEELEAALENAADDPEAQTYALRLSIEQVNNMKKSMSQSQEEFRKEMSKNKTAIAQIAKELSLFRAARKAQDAEGFNAVHHVHSMVLELQTKHDKMMATTSELVNEYNRREKTFEELVGHVERIQQSKADKQDVNQEINVKADKMELESKVSMNQFDEGFNLLDRGLSEALEKMESQMSIEDALKSTLSELQSKLSLKLDRNDLDNLRSQLESRIRDIPVVQTVVREKPEDGEPAGFRRNVTEKVHCISCDRPLEVSKPTNPNPNMPKIQGLPSHKSAKPYTTYELEQIRQTQKMSGLRKASINADLPYSAQKLRNEVVAMTGMVDIVDLPPSQRYCGGSHTIMHPFRRSVKSTSSHFNQYVVIREEVDSKVALPRRDFIVPKESNIKRFGKTKLPAIGQTNMRETSPLLEYDTYPDRPSSAPATPGPTVYPRERSLTSPSKEVLVDTFSNPDGKGSPIEVDRISVTLPSPVEES